MKSVKCFTILGLVLGCVFMIVGQAAAYPEWRVDFIESDSPDGPVAYYITDISGLDLHLNSAQTYPEGATIYQSSFWGVPYGTSYVAMTEPGTNGLISDLLGVTWNEGIHLGFESDQEGQYLAPPTNGPITYVQENGELQLLYSVIAIVGGADTLISVYGQSDVSESVPEPTTMLLLGFGLMGLAGVRRKFSN